jgi:uncharacterized membrane protein (TIGR02234 family)
VNPRRAYITALGLLAFGAVIVLTAAGRRWGSAEVAEGSGSTAARRLYASGSDVSGGLPALALLALAGVLAVVATRGVARRGVGVVLVLVGVLVIVLAATGDLSGALDAAARTASGVSSARAGDASATPWRWVCVFGGLLVTAAGALAGVRSSGWPALGARYERGTPRTARPLDAWSALDRGIDPTEDPTDTMSAPEDNPSGAREERT